MRTWLTYVRLLLPWWLFRRTGPSDVARVDWALIRWGEQAPWTGTPVGPYVADISHICHPKCKCALAYGGHRLAIVSHTGG